MGEEAEHLPPCLAERAGLTGSVFCHICGVVLASAADAVSHNAEKHSAGHVVGRDMSTESTTCSYCGLALPTPGAVAVHQMVVNLSARCGLHFNHKIFNRGSRLTVTLRLNVVDTLTV